MTSTPARRTTGRGASSGWSMLALLARAVSTFVIATAYGRDAATRSCALAMRLVATSSCAFVIFLVDFTDLIRRRNAPTWAGMASLPRRRRPDAGHGLVALGAVLQRLGRRLVDHDLAVLAEEHLLEVRDGGV